jgi:hypothetical protein
MVSFRKEVTHMKTQEITLIGLCSALYAAVGYLTAGITFFGIGFLPAVVIPAVFAVLFGPWVGGISGAIGIFIRDVFVHGNAFLSLTAGVPANFILFFIIGYFTFKQISLKQAVMGIIVAAVGLLVPTIIFLQDILAYTGLSTEVFAITYLSTVVFSLTVITIVSVRWTEWRSYAIAAVMGLIFGGALLSITVWLVSPFFLTFFQHPIAASLIFPIFVWLITTEIPFILLLGPPIIKACYRAFPSLRRRKKPREPY